MSTTGTHAFITPSYEGDFERFQLLCESMDEMATGDWCHYVLVANHDVALFRTMEGPRRKVIADSEILPKWLFCLRNPLNKRWVWLSRNLLHPVWPMSGWHVQQLRKMLIARHIAEPLLVFADSDTIMMRRFGVEAFYKNGLPRLYSKPHGIVDDSHYKAHHQWVEQSGAILQVSPETLPATDYIGNLVTWRRDHALTMLDHIEKKSGRELAAAMGRYRSFSEYLIYGNYVERVLGVQDQPPDAHELTMTYWGKDTTSEWSLDGFMSGLSQEHIAMGIQSFTDIPVEKLRHFYRGVADRLR